ncbi:dihydroorotase [Aquirufa lenticrescens]|uniref:dihydroorotase n=1 Tax=Aquirufa lenticrescens TaxID=2696560 RepID=UPI001CAA60AD|nr:dihydroorotase [Aquirufa lenticrescens]UAJ13809.1 dihydroorotase [Aquirufa lenticrescens]
MTNYVLKNAQIVNEGRIIASDLRIENGRIAKIATDITPTPGDIVLDVKGKHVFPGMIDDQVHFREPGLTHKATIASEARAAVAGGVTSFMEMPNTVPNALTQELLADKYAIAAAGSLANYSFFMGAGNDNLEEVLKTNSRDVCGIKIFMGSSTGNMLVDNAQTLEKLFSSCEMLIATHCEDEPTVRARTALFKEKYPENAPAYIHPLVRNEEACYLSSSMAVDLAKKNNTRLHILHISTEEELALFETGKAVKDKKITAEVCVHHLWFDAAQYDTLGNQIKCNPAIKDARHKTALRKALVSGALDIIATDHAPHTWDEKSQEFWKSPSGLPLVQHPLLLMIDLAKEGHISLELIAEKTAHSVADCFQIEERGYIREGYWADLAIVDLNKSFTVSKANILYQCGWSPLEGHTLSASVEHTFVSGHLAYSQGSFDESKTGKRLLFNR